MLEDSGGGGCQRDSLDFKADMGSFLDHLQHWKKAIGVERIFYAGQKEHESEARSLSEGVRLSEKVVQQLSAIGEELHVAMPRVASV